MKKHFRNLWGLYLFLIAAALIIAGCLIYRANTVRYPGTAEQARQGCATHDHVRSISAPGDTGAYVVCEDGHVFHTSTGRHWK